MAYPGITSSPRWFVVVVSIFTQYSLSSSMNLSVIVPLSHTTSEK